MRAAGAAPLYTDSSGNSRDLDKDGDGVTCE
ncbi:excalibur calcium-binding domain-containing protein [Corynebacterium sp. KPL3927]